MFTNTQDYYWVFNNALSPDTCDKIIKLGLSKKTVLARTHEYDKDKFKNLNKTQKINLKKIRKLSLVACLSNPKEFKGGDFEFQFRNNNDPTIITPAPELRNKGTIVVFPSFLYHRVTPLIKGTRYSLVMWTRGNLYW